jgi:hypothetical protein
MFVSGRLDVTSVTVGFALADRVAKNTSAAATFSFTTTAGGALAAGSTITLTARDRSQRQSMASVAAPLTSTQIVVTTSEFSQFFILLINSFYLNPYANLVLLLRCLLRLFVEIVAVTVETFVLEFLRSNISRCKQS